MSVNRDKIIVVLRVLAGMGFAILCGGVLYAAAYWLLQGYYARSGVHWTDFGRHMATWGLGSLMFLITGAAFGYLSHPKQIAVWKEIMDALIRIAKGDFSVSLKRANRYQGQFGELMGTINHMAKELQQMEALRQEFISNVSHEIQSPLTSIRGFANTLQQEDLTPEERRHYLSIIEEESARLSNLSDNLLKLTSLESMQQPFDVRPYRLDLQLRHAVLACEPQWLEKKQEVELALQPVTIEADEDLLRQVWVNLIHNAVKFTPPCGSLKVRLEREERRAVVEVADTGPGIPLEDQPRIFERFYKGDKSRTRTTEGSGLGLSIVGKIVEMHHGSIVVESNPGQGSVFRVTLPLHFRMDGLPHTKQPIEGESR